MKRTAISLLSFICIALFAWMIVEESDGPDTTTTTVTGFVCPVHGCGTEKGVVLSTVPHRLDNDIIAKSNEHFPFPGYYQLDVLTNTTECRYCPKCAEIAHAWFPSSKIRYTGSDTYVMHAAIPPIYH